jgi:hypothetical protein
MVPERGKQADDLVMDVPDALTHHTFVTVVILLVYWWSIPMGSKTYVQLLSYNYVKTHLTRINTPGYFMW